MKRLRIFITAVLLASLSVAAQGACMIQGRVVDGATGQPLANPKVFIDPRSDNGRGVPIRHLADANGEFCFEHLDAGRYIVRAGRPGYMSGSYGRQHSDGPALILEVSPDKQWLNLVVKLSPQAVIRGTVVDSDGDPIARATVKLFEQSSRPGKVRPNSTNQDQADDEGRFSFSGLDAGTYYVSAQPENDHPGRNWEVLDANAQPFRELEAETYYGESLSMRGATPIVLKEGQEVTGVTVALQKTALRHLSGRVASMPAGERSWIWVTRVSEDEGEAVVAAPRIGKDGTFRAESLLPGEYELQELSGDGNALGQMSVDLTERDVDGLVFEPLPMLNLELLIHTESGKAEGKNAFEQVFLFNSKSGYGFVPRRDENGKLIFKDLASGVYSVNPPRTREYFIKRIAIDGEPQNGTTIDLRRPAKLLEVTLSTNFAALAGTLQTERPITNGIAVVLQNDREHDDKRYALVTTSGEFHWTSLPPGRYHVYAFEEFDENAWEKPEVAGILAKKSVAIELHEGEKRQVKVPLITRKEVEEAR